ncbi:MAG: hypothetical protein PHI97_05495 [Desulfobulbus sp.]|nr:hypothetical protein [Desulfobulbus sp.]
MFFGLNRETDERSLVEFLQHFTDEQLTQALIPRMSEEEINQIVDLLGAIMKNHLSSDEYHRLFLHEEHHHH